MALIGFANGNETADSSDSSGTNATSYTVTTASGVLPEAWGGGDWFGWGALDAWPQLAGAPFALVDDSGGVFPPDTQGIIDTTFGVGNAFFGIVDTANGFNPDGTATAQWTFDISGGSDMSLSIDFAAMGDFEISDSWVFSYAIDGGSFVDTFVTAVDEAGSQNYTLESGTVVNLSDPMQINGVTLNNAFQTLTAAIFGTGSELTLRLTGATDGGSEAFAFDNIAIDGTTGPAPNVIGYANGNQAGTIDDVSATNALTFSIADGDGDDPAGWTSAGDAFGWETRVSAPFSLVDDSGGTFPPDSLGIIDSSYASGDEFFGVTDTANGDNLSGDTRAQWTFDITGSTELGVTLDIGAMGDFEASDVLTLSYSIDGGAPVTLLTTTADEAGSQSYTLEGGGVFLLNDPLTIDGAALNNTLKTVGGAIAGTGSVLTVTLDANFNGGTEAVVFDNLRVIENFAGIPDGPDDPEPGVYTDRLISEIQGSGASVTNAGELVRVSAVITGVYADLGGFFVQEEDADADADTMTSEGIFVFAGGDLAGYAEGQTVTVEGMAEEFFGMSQIDAAAGLITLDDVGNSLGSVSASVLDLPSFGANDAAGTFESVEGMLVQYADPLVVSEYFQLARFGQITAYEGTDRPLQFTQTNAPDAVAYAAYLEELATRRVIIDDTNNFQNADTVYHPAPDGFSVDNVVRGGDVAYDVAGILHWSWAGGGGTDAWRLRPTDANPIEFTAMNPRTDAPDDVGGSLKVATFNVLNYFTTLDDGVNTTATGLSPRGANSQAELDRQTDKIVAALAAMDSDIVGLIEIENDDDTSLATLVAALNAEVGAGTYDYVATGVIGGDAIKVGFIYDTTSVKIADGTSVAVLDDPSFLDPLNSGRDLNRPAVAVTFEDLSTGGQFTAVNNHLKSKGSPSGVEGDDRPETGEGNAAGTREAAADMLAAWLDTNPTGSDDSDVMIMGDLNSYAKEGAITELETEGFTNLLSAFQPGEAYSYLFDGQLGTLDYAFASGSLLGQVTGATAWNINSDEVNLLDYNDSIVDPGEASFEAKPDTTEFYAADAYRSSDHDPIIVGLDLEPEFIFLSGTDKRDFIRGTDENEIIKTGLKTDTVLTGGGRDIVDLTMEATNGRADVTFIVDFDVELDAIAGYTRDGIAREINVIGNTILIFDDRDHVFLRGVEDSSEITFSDQFLF